MRDLFLTALKHWVGAERALNIYWFLYEYALLLLTGVALIIAALSFVILFRPQPHVHDAYETAEVIGLLPLPSETSAQKTVLDLRLKDATPLRLIVRTSDLHGTLDTVCLERRRFTETGAPRYRVAPAHNCTLP